jgi:hypothetical protein
VIDERNQVSGLQIAECKDKAKVETKKASLSEEKRGPPVLGLMD